MAVKTCFICGSTSWHDVDYLRSDPENMSVCKACGFVTFHRFFDHDEYLSYYDHEYRTPRTVNHSNIVTTNRKIGYHESFLGPYLKQLRERKKNGDIIIGEIGAGIGYFLRWARDKYNCKVYGSELTNYFRRYAEHAFNINLTRDFDYSEKYDVIACYHTIEHIPDPVEVLTKLRDCIKDDGILYIATPIWMSEMMEFGGGPFTTFDHFFHKDHINAWSYWHFEALLRKTGWKIIKENKQSYGWTMFLEKTDRKETGRQTVNAEDVIESLHDMSRAAKAYRKGNFSEAIRLYPRFVDAYLNEISKYPKDFDKQIRLCETGAKMCPNTILFAGQLGLILYQYDRLDEAEEEFKKVIRIKPHDDNVLLHAGLIYLRRGEKLIKTDYKKGKECFKVATNIFSKIIEINPTTWQQCSDYIAYIFSVCPTEEEEKNGILKKFEAPTAEDSPTINFLK